MIDYQKELNEEQYKVVAEGDGACLVLAGAGSGKTRTITYRVAYLLENGVPEDRILLLTFTNKAASEMMERLRELLSHQLPGLRGGTFHSVAARILRHYADRIGYQQNFTILDASDAEGIVSLAMRDEGVDLKSKLYPKASLMLSIISFSRNAQLTIEDTIELKFGGFARIADTIARVAVRYETRKRESNVMDFDDLLINFLTLLETDAAVSIALSDQYQYVLVDEYQDTNTLQVKIVKLLAAVHGNVIAVGDDAQSIYSFRAANIANILQFEKDYKNARIFRMETNYRSAPEILALANSVISKNKAQHKKNLKAVCAATVKPHVVTLSSTFEEAAYVADTIEDRHYNGLPYNGIAVLFRAAHHSQALEVELMKRRIPYDYRGGLRFFDRAHVKDVLSYMKVLHNVHDVMAWQRILTMQGGIGDKTANKILQALKHLTSSTELVAFELGDDMPERAHNGWRGIVTIISDMINNSNSVGGIIEAILRSGYRDYLTDHFDNASDRVADIEQLQTYASRSKDLSQFLTDTSLSEEYAKKSDKDRGDRVVLSTIHQAKGLEWDTVLVIRLVAGGFPHERAMGEKGGVEEERRLLYVAITRAKKYLYLTYPVLGGTDGSMFFQPSQFLSDFDPLLIESGMTDTGGNVISVEGNDELEYVSETSNGLPRTGFLSSVEDL